MSPFNKAILFFILVTLFSPAKLNAKVKETSESREVARVLDALHLHASRAQGKIVIQSTLRILERLPFPLSK